jgi:SAM-dependent methyltransferase
MRPFEGWRRRAVERLELREGDSVIDVACGTGLSLPLLRSQVGPSGRIVGVDLSREMLDQARELIAAEGWQNVTLIEAGVDRAQLGCVADAALFSFTHDVLQSPPAVSNVVAHLRPNARLVSVGVKRAGRWNLAVNFLVQRGASTFLTTNEDLSRPWRQLERFAGTMPHRAFWLGGGYVAWGRLAA